MKIRTDFVTNSSSSSFCVEIDFDLKNGSTISFEAEGATGETGPINYFNGEAIIKASPKYLGTSKDINELIKRLSDGVLDLAWDADVDDEVETRIFEKSYPVESEWGEVCDAYEFIKEIKKRIHSVEDIRAITVSGTENGVDGEEYKQVYNYDLENKEYTGVIYGCEFESEGSAGSVSLSDLDSCKLEYKDSSAIDDDEDDENDDFDLEEDNLEEDDSLEYEKYTLDEKWEIGSWRNKHTKKVERSKIIKYIGNEENVVVPEGIFEIEDEAFQDCKNIVSITFPESLMRIGSYAFENCTHLQNVVLPSQITYIDEETFSNCKSCEKITFLTNEPIEISDDAFSTSGVQVVEALNSEFVIVSPYFEEEIEFHIKSGVFSAEELSDKFEEMAKKIKADSKKFKEYPLGKDGVSIIEECIMIEYQNKQIEKVIEMFNYESDVCEPFSIDCCIDLGVLTLDDFSENKVAPFPYYGVNNLESLTKTIISFLINNGSFDDGFLESMMENFDSIINSYQMIDGSVVSCVDRDEDCYAGYLLELKKGKYSCKANDCIGGW